MSLSIENPKEFTKKKKKRNHLDLTSEFSKVIEHKINLQKSIIFLDINNGQEETNQNHSTIVFPMQIIEISLTKHIQVLNEEDYEMLMKEIKD